MLRLSSCNHGQFPISLVDFLPFKGIQRAAENQSGESTKEILALCSQKKRKNMQVRLKPWSISLAEQQPDSRSAIEVVVHKNEIDLCWCAKTLNNRFQDSQTYRNRGFKSLNPAPVVNYGRCKQSKSKVFFCLRSAEITSCITVYIS